MGNLGRTDYRNRRSIMTDKLKQSNKLKQLTELESCVMSFWDRLDDDMQEEIRCIMDIDEDDDPGLQDTIVV